MVPGKNTQSSGHYRNVGAKVIYRRRDADNETGMAGSQKNKRASLGILFWLAFILLIAVVFLSNKTHIQQVLETTGLVSVLKDKLGVETNGSPQVVGRQKPEGDTAAPSDGGTTGHGNNDVAVELQPVHDETESPQAPPAGEDGSTVSPQAAPQHNAPASPAESASPAASPAPVERPQPQQHSRVSKIYFIRVTDDGTIYPQQVERTVTYRDSPMTQTINALLKGPTIEELNLGLLNLIPDKTRLLSAAIKNGVAYLSFSEEFQFNPMGVEGFAAQLQQIVYSATEFSTIQRVQILIEGKKVDYLGGEGVYIGGPLSRDSFG